MVRFDIDLKRDGSIVVTGGAKDSRTLERVLDDSDFADTRDSCISGRQKNRYRDYFKSSYGSLYYRCSAQGDGVWPDLTIVEFNKGDNREPRMYFIKADEIGAAVNGQYKVDLSKRKPLTSGKGVKAFLQIASFVDVDYAKRDLKAFLNGMDKND